ncbi:alpha/beta fold hydrolase [Methylobacterium dankookense]|uniref:2-succinyl-6-hydroxy-2, 4-cyclohexadiene-1-carboxylate synthase n=1 Tax=Methylobacterium dankookense TaxID=560405 RepID=A0A564FRC3_9HYPH|nr:alpha/beta fold hydrolase [Methylobacterium dankookense]GJD56867.1 2-succinyl-6-hydroxy-2, 4-cyclohexadiene-1-carboxylate synthase [Methylobacterium dankookense]VUF10729.1 Dihydrolipoyllysine-residue acetyltransferase component of acetoin cleaving system [Methylobacterium dankookense]
MASGPAEAPRDADSGVLDLGGQRLEYRRAGPAAGEGATILLLHEGLGSADGWWPFADVLAAATGRPVLAYSRAGYGRSSPVALPRPADYLEREARAVLPRLLDAAGIRDCILVGHSDGATISALAAAAGDPRIRAAILIAPHVFVEDVTLAGVARARRAFEEDDLRERLAARHDDVEGAFRGWSDTWLDPARRGWDVRADLRGLTVPLAVIQGTRDRYGSADQIEAVRASCPQAEIHHLPGIGHVPHEEDPAGALRILADFIGRSCA